MKHKTYCLLFVLLIGLYQAQNWNVFNKNYRYNYKYDNSVLISQVLFADSVKQQGTDTLYYMNRIGFECTGNCPGFTSVLNPTTTAIIPNMPQFLQRTVKKLPNGWTVLKDTATLVIIPNCLLNQTWLFDSVNNKTAVCVAKISKVLFGVNDSVKNIIVGGTDTLILSKRFGIVQFPNLYNKNKYYRLVGIENANSYDSTALYGIKVPNAWDFYNYDVGDKFCYRWNNHYLHTDYYFAGSCTVTTKSIGTNAYNYNFANLNSNNSSTTTSVYPENYTALNTPLLENRMYPGQIITTDSFTNLIGSGFMPGTPYNIVRFGLDNKGSFYKAAGVPCSFLPAITFPTYGNMTQGGYNFNATGGYFTFYNWNNPAYFESAIIFEVGIGKIASCYSNQTDYLNMCKTCVVKKGNTYFGNVDFVGLSENAAHKNSFKIYPNPANAKLNVSFNNPLKEVVHLSIYNVYGQLLWEQELTADEGNNSTSTDIENYPAGVYLIHLKTSEGILKSKFVKE